jgi:hypothetical protein
MNELVIQTMAKAITFANLSDPHPEPGVTVLRTALPSVDSRRLAVAAIRALDEAGYKIVAKTTDA